MNRRYRWFGIMAVVLGAALTFSPGADSIDKIGGQAGMYAASQPSPDSLTTWEKGKRLLVTRGTATPERPSDLGKVRMTTGTDTGTAVFVGRSTDWGCAYSVKGRYVTTLPAVTRKDEQLQPRTQKLEWVNSFTHISTARIAVEINDDGSADDVVLLGEGGGTLHVRVLDDEQAIERLLILGRVEVGAQPVGDIDDRGRRRAAADPTEL